MVAVNIRKDKDKHRPNNPPNKSKQDPENRLNNLLNLIINTWGFEILLPRVGNVHNVLKGVGDLPQKHKKHQTRIPRLEVADRVHVYNAPDVVLDEIYEVRLRGYGVVERVY